MKTEKREADSRRQKAGGGEQERRSKFAPLLLLGLFALALSVRLIGLTWGLPNAGRWYSYHPDESWHQMAGAVASIAGGAGWNPRFFNYPSLDIYLTYFSYLLLNVFGLTTPAPDAASTWPALRDIIFAGRLVTAFLGALTILPVFGLARQMGGVRLAILAAVLFAFLPGHVQHSHFATVDVPATFFVMLCLWLSARSLRENAPDDKWRMKQLLWAALVAGLAAATKYNAGLVVVAPLMALFLNRRAGTMKLGAAIGAIAIAGFLLGCPFSVLDFKSFWGDGLNGKGGQNGFAYELLVHPKQGSGDIFTNTGNGWWYHATFNLPFVMTWPLLIASVAGVVYVVVRRREVGSVPWVLLSFAALYFLTLGLSQVRFMRYVLPIAPILCIFAALGARQMALWLRAPNLAPLFAALLGLTVLIGATNILFPLVSVDPRDQAVESLRRLASPSDVSVGLIENPWFFTPPLSPRDKFSPPAPALTSFNDRFEVDVIGFNPLAGKPQWIVVNDFEWRDKDRLHDPAYLTFKSWLDNNYALAARFQNRAPLELPGRAFVAYDFLYTNPATRLYRRIDAP